MGLLHSPHHPPHPHHRGVHTLHTHHVRILGLPISLYSYALLERLATRAHLKAVHVTSVERKVEDQARIFFHKHVVEGKRASYKNPEVTRIIHQARELHRKGNSERAITAYLVKSIEDAHGGPQSVSRHLGRSPFIEIFDVAHYSGPTTGRGRHNYMTALEAQAFLAACRAQMTFPVTRLGHSAELGFERPEEFGDEKCFHLEIAQPYFERVTSPAGTMIT